MSGFRSCARAWLFALASGLCVLVPAQGGARETLQVSLDYEADPALAGCPSRAEFHGGVVRELGYDPVRQSAPRRIVVRLRPVSGHIEGRVEWRGANDEWEGDRGFSSRRESCAQIARAMALATAIQIQLLAGAERAPFAEPVRAPPGTAQPLPTPAPNGAQGTTQEPAQGKVTEKETAAAPDPPDAAKRATPADTPGVAKEPRFAVDLGAGLLQDLGDAPTMLVPRVAIAVGRPSTLGVRLAVSGFGPEAELSLPEGSGRIARSLATLTLVRSFRLGGMVQPFVAAGGGLHHLRARGFSTMPSVAPAHDGAQVSGVATAGGGVAFMLDTRLAIVVEAEALLFWPSVSIQIGNTEAAHFGSVTLFAHAGLLARF